MNIFAILSLIESFTALSLGTFVLAKNTKIQLNRIFSLLCFTLCIVGFCEFGMRQTSSYEEAYLFLRISDIFPLGLSFLLHFSLIFSEKMQKLRTKLIYVIIYLPGIILTYLAITTGYMGKEPLLTYWGWTYGEKENPLYYIYILWSLSIGIISISLCLLKFLKSRDFRTRAQSKLIIFGISINLIIFLLVDIIIVTILQIQLPEFGVASYTICCIFIGYAIWKYQLFTLNFITASETIISNISDPLILINSNYKITAVNQSTLRILNYKENELINKPFVILLNSVLDKNKFNLLVVYLEKKKVVNEIELKFKTKTNKKLLISLAASSIRDNMGQLQGIVLIGRDITKKKEIENELKQLLEKQKLFIEQILEASQFKSDFMSGISHELRTPLNSIIGFSDLLLEGSYGNINIDQRDYLNDIKFSSEHLLELINNLLDLSKIETGKLELNISKIELNSFIKQIRDTIMPLYQEKNLYFELDGETNNGEIYADPVRLKEILYNLLSNAIKFTINGGIKLKISEKKEFWEFRINDTGIGIAKEDHKLIFQEFKRVKSSYVSTTPGTGLGLVLTKKLVDLHGGKIWFESELKKGTTFYIIIPKNIKKDK